MAEYISIDDANQMYSGSLCFYKGNLVKVEEVYGDMRADIRTLDGKAKSVPFNLDDFTAPNKGRLGYVNLDGIAAYLYRVPVRQYSNGITRGNVRYLIGGGGFPYTDKEAYKIETVRLKGWAVEALRDTLKGKYPSLRAAGELLKAGARLVAFDRQFAASSNGVVYYKDKAVGTFNKDKQLSSRSIAWEDGFSEFKSLIGKFKLSK